jgi:hypothetical protein
MIAARIESELTVDKLPEVETGMVAEFACVLAYRLTADQKLVVEDIIPAAYLHLFDGDAGVGAQVALMAPAAVMSAKSILARTLAFLADFLPARVARLTILSS